MKTRFSWLTTALLSISACDPAQGRPVGPTTRTDDSLPTAVRSCAEFDLDGDGIVAFADQLAVSAAYGETVDGVTYDFAFFLGLSGWFGSECPTPTVSDAAGCLVRGDLDGDDQLTANDLDILTRVAQLGSPHADVLAVSDYDGSGVVGDADADAMAQALAGETPPTRVCVTPPQDGATTEGGVALIAWSRIADANYDDRAVHGWLVGGGKRVRALGKQTLDTQCAQPDADTALSYQRPVNMQPSELATLEIQVDEGLTIVSVDQCPGQSEVVDGGNKARCTAPICALTASTPSFEVLSTGVNYDEDWLVPDGYILPDCTNADLPAPQQCCIALWDHAGSSVDCAPKGLWDCTAEPSCFWEADATCANLTEDGVQRLLPSGCDVTHVAQLDDFDCGGLPSWLDECADIDLHYFGHGMGATSLTNLAYTVCRGADSCTNASLRDWGCETFSDLEHARARAELLADRLEAEGKSNIRVEVTGNTDVAVGARECVDLNQAMLRLTQTPVTFWVHDGDCDQCDTP